MIDASRRFLGARIAWWGDISPPSLSQGLWSKEETDRLSVVQSGRDAWNFTFTQTYNAISYAGLLVFARVRNEPHLRCDEDH